MFRSQLSHVNCQLFSWRPVHDNLVHARPGGAVAVREKMHAVTEIPEVIKKRIVERFWGARVCRKIGVRGAIRPQIAPRARGTVRRRELEPDVGCRRLVSMPQNGVKLRAARNARIECRGVKRAARLTGARHLLVPHAIECRRRALGVVFGKDPARGANSAGKARFIKSAVKRFAAVGFVAQEKTGTGIARATALVGCTIEGAIDVKRIIIARARYGEMDPRIVQGSDVDGRRRVGDGVIIGALKVATIKVQEAKRDIAAAGIFGLEYLAPVAGCRPRIEPGREGGCRGAHEILGAFEKIAD